MDETKFPPSLRSTSKRIDKARQLVEKRFAIKTAKGELAPFQGMWSETYIVTKADGHKAVIQLRAEPLDIGPFQRAKKLLGPYCPDVELLQDEELIDTALCPVFLSFIAGHSWCTDPKHRNDQQFNVTVMSSLGKLLARCVIDEKSPDVDSDDLIQKLDRRLASKQRELDPYRDVIRDLKERVETSSLAKLPLFQSHMDLNEMNIMVNNQGDVTGIVDWELSPPYQPFGVGLHRIHELAGSFNNQIYRQKDEYYEMESAFWDGILSALPAHHRLVVNQHLEDVQLAITIGTVLWAFDFDTGGEYINPAILAALPKFLTYRIPALRGEAPAYDDSASTKKSSNRKTDTKQNG